MNEENVQKTSAADVAQVFAGMIGIAAILMTGYGVAIACGFSQPAVIVGGDAYNYLIAGVRGLAWIGAGIVAAVLAAAIAVIATRD